MKTHNNLWQQITSFQNLLSAYKKAQKGARSKKCGYKFFYNLENELLELQTELKENIYKPGKYKLFKVHEPKERVIAAAPFKDRVVHHAIINILEPIYEKVFISNSYATRKGKGTHKAVLKVQEYLRKNRWYFKTDISKYFDSINKNLLIEIIKRKIRDKKTIGLIEKIIFNDSYNVSEIGLPVGNLTSQFFANVYLNQLDHYIKDELGTKYYIRYMDDLVILTNCKETLKELRSKIEIFVEQKLQLKLKEKATFINKRENGLSFLGMRIFSNIIRIKKENLKRSIKKIKQREKEFEYGIINEQKLFESVQSVFAHLSFYNTYRLRCSLNFGKLS